MARARKIGGKALAAREAMRAPAASRTRATARTTRLRSDGGQGGDDESFWQTITRPSALFMTSLLAFLVVSGMKVWESGMLDPVIGPRGAGPIESGPVRFAPRERAPAKEYVAAPEPAAPEDAADGEN